MLLTTIIVFILILGLLVFVHEAGHFFAARRLGVKVEEFGFGFPPRIFAVKRNETLYSINLLPLGGFVKIFGEGGEEKKNWLSFASRSITQRFLMLVSGVTMNLVLAIFLFGVGNILGLPTLVTEENERLAKDVKVQIIETIKEAPADKAGIRMGDIIEAVATSQEASKGNFTKITTTEELANFTSQNAGSEIVLKIKRGKETKNISVLARANPPQGEGPLGIALARTGIISYPPHVAMWMGAKNTFELTEYIVVKFSGIVKDLAMGIEVKTEVTGPVGIAVLTGQIAQLGFIYLLQFTAILSLNLAIINALPIPALDGGRILFLLIEAIKGVPISQKLENLIHNIGFAILIVLILIITFQDISRFDIAGKILDLFMRN